VGEIAFTPTFILPPQGGGDEKEKSFFART